MNTKRVKIAIYKDVQYGHECAFINHREDGTEPVFSGYVRQTQFVTVVFPARTDDEFAAEKRAETDAARKRLTQQLAALGEGT